QERVASDMDRIGQYPSNARRSADLILEPCRKTTILRRLITVKNRRAKKCTMYGGSSERSCYSSNDYLVERATSRNVDHTQTIAGVSGGGGGANGRKKGHPLVVKRVTTGTSPVALTVYLNTIYAVS
ncbi:MAG: hypothetical protein R6U98_27050, partial [Pirellulaceae bacterium]